MKIIGFVGPKFSGKDSSADILKDRKLSLGKIALANPLKEICREVFKLTDQQIHLPQMKEKDFETPIVINTKHLRAIKKLLVEYVNPNEFPYRPQAMSTTGVEGVAVRNPRELLQLIGTEFIRNKARSDWHLLAAFSKKALSNLKSDGTYCVTDIRFLNEYEFIKAHFRSKFDCYYVERPSAEVNLALATHPSELGVKEIKALLPEENVIKAETMDELKKAIKSIFK